MRAIVLISGGLDSILAAKLIKEQGIEIVPLNFKIPFSSRKEEFADRYIADSLGIEPESVDISNDFLRLLENARYGFGANMNPCIDCRILMLRKAKELMLQLKAVFVATGEVLGQRPMSQNKQSLALIEEKAGLGGLILRPLSAKLLAQTLPEQRGWVLRERLLAFSGRSRRPQLELAKTFNLQDYLQPAGGCLLTDPGFAKRLKDIINHRGLSADDVELLKTGRHFRLSKETKLVVGRNEAENRALLRFSKKDDYLFRPSAELKGPNSLARGFLNEELIRVSCRITLRYCDLNGKPNADILYKRASQEKEIVLNVTPLSDSCLESLRL